jgi:F0F1-type ATP synthase membrane subunit b/b'
MGYLLKGTTLKGVLNVSSNHINVNDFLSPSEETAEPEAEQVAEESTEPGVTEMTAIEVPANIDFRAQVNMAEVLMDKMAFRDIKGLLIIKDRKVDMQNLSLNTMGGGVVANGSYATPIGERARLAAGFALNDIVFKQAYQELDMVQKLAPLFEGLSGSFSGSVKVDTPLDEKMSPVLMSLNGEGSLSTKSISLSGISAIDQVADLLQKPELKNINARDLKIDFTIKDGRVQTKPFDIKMGDYVMNLSGSTGLDQTIDYVGKIAIPASAGELARLGSVDMTITGTFSSPKVSIDFKGMAKQALDQVVDQVKEQAEQKVDEIKQQAEQKIEDVKQQAQQRVEETKQQVEQKVEQAKQEAKQQVEQKVEEAKQQAQQKVDEVKQQAQQKAQEAAKDAVSKILGGSASSAQGEAADSLSQQQKTTEAVKGVLNLFKKKN